MTTRRYRTFDSPTLGRKARDTILSVPTDAEWAVYLKQRGRYGMDPGKYFDGLEAGLASMEPELRDELYKRVDAYRSDATRVASTDAKASIDAAAWEKRFDPLGRRKSADQNQALNDAARARWGQKPTR